MTTATTINSFLYRMQQDPNEHAFLSPGAWQNFLASIADDEKRIYSVTDKQIHDGLKEFNGERFSSKYSNGSDEPIRISYVKFSSKSDLTFFMLRWA
jgi:hypothetical protein